MLAITMGDANGVGPEILLKACRDGLLEGDFIAVGDLAALRACGAAIGCAPPMKSISAPAEYAAGALNVLDAGALAEADLSPGKLDARVAAASREYVVTATRLAQLGQVAGIVTLPVNKEGIRLQDPHFTGHTELIAGLLGQPEVTMMLAGEKLTVTHVSTHVSMARAVQLVTRDRVLDVIRLTHRALARFNPAPRLAVAGLNPHAGEGGAFGMQEIEEIAPAIEQARREGLSVQGPMPPDTVFLRASRGEFDAVVCMYHDQGHIPMKLLDFEGGVNVTLGLDIIRTSVDHGTAFDIAWQGKASCASLAAAYRYTRRMAG